MAGIEWATICGRRIVTWATLDEFLKHFGCDLTVFDDFCSLIQCF